MKLDLLYEIDVPKPWGDKPFPYGQKEHDGERIEGVHGLRNDRDLVDVRVDVERLAGKNAR